MINSKRYCTAIVKQHMQAMSCHKLLIDECYVYFQVESTLVSAYKANAR